MNLLEPIGGRASRFQAGIGEGDPRERRGEIALSGRGRLARAKPRDSAVAEVPAGLGVAIELGRKPDLGVRSGKTKVGWHDADDAARDAVDGEDLSDDGAVGMKAAAPDRFTEDHRFGAAGAILFFRE